MEAAVVHIRSYRDLEVWQEAVALAEDCHRITRSFPRDEIFGLTSQVRRAAVSIPSNVAEGHNRLTTRAFLHHLSIALGSEGELDTLVEIAMRVGYVPRAAMVDLSDRRARVGRQLRGLVAALER
jgi:four helix bundle protein